MMEVPSPGSSFMVRGGALSLRPWPRGSLASCPLLTLTMTVASGGVCLLSVVVQVALGAGPRSFSKSRGPWEQAGTNLYKKRVPLGRREGRRGSRASKLRPLSDQTGAQAHN